MVTELRDAAGAVVATATSPVTRAARRAGRGPAARLPCRDPPLWSPDSPALYTARGHPADGDEPRRRRHRHLRRPHPVAWTPQRGLRINGEPVLLRGACVHSDNGVLGAATIGRAEERRVELLKAAGFNALRSAHNPMSRAMLDACDRLGVLVMDELTDMWTESKTDFDAALDFPEWWERDVEAMVRKDLNHPSVVIYSIGNEIPEVGTPARRRSGRGGWPRRCASLDPTRFVTNGDQRHARRRSDEATGAAGGRGAASTRCSADMGEFMDELVGVGAGRRPRPRSPTTCSTSPG